MRENSKKMDRFSIFNNLKIILQKSQPFFESLSFNPIDVLISLIYIETINHSSKGQEYQRTTKKKSVLQNIKGYAQIQLRPFKEYFVSKTNITKNHLKSPILFFPTEPTHIMQFDPIWKYLQKEKIDYFIVTTKKAIYKSLKVKKHPIIWINASTPLSNKKEYRNIILALNAFFQSDTENISKNETIHNSIRTVIENNVRSIYILSERINQLFRDFSPSCVVPGYDITPSGRLLTILARKSNIPSYCVMHGSVTGEPLDTIHIVDHFCLFGEAVKQDLLKKGVPEYQLIVTGAPYLDDFISTSTDIHPLLKTKLSLTNSKPYFLIAMSGPGHSTSHAHFQMILENLFKIAAQYPMVQWVIKMHRKDSMENYEEVLSRYNNHNIKIIENNALGFPKSIFEWLQGTTALITGNSTVALEAMSLGIPVVTMDFMNEYQMVDFINLGTTIHITNPIQLKTAIENLTSASSAYIAKKQVAADYISNYFYKSMTSATENIVKHMNAYAVLA